MRVLVVDDSRAMRMIVTRMLRQAGYDADIVEAENGVSGMARLSGDVFDLILSDWNMPEMNGLDFVTAVRSAGHLTPFVFVTTEWTEEMRSRAEQAGANALLAKPFTPERLDDVLRSVL